MSPDSPQPAQRPPHPLAVELIERLRAQPGATVLEVGPGSGRNTAAIAAAGFPVAGLESRAICSAALSTHALLHGTPSSISQTLQRIAGHVAAGAPLFATFGSTRDGRFGRGTRIEESVYAPDEGDERGVAHAYFTEDALRELLHRDWRVESLCETGVDEIAGSWAHAEQPLRDAVHWFVVALRR